MDTLAELKGRDAAGNEHAPGGSSEGGQFVSTGTDAGPRRTEKPKKDKDESDRIAEAEKDYQENGTKAKAFKEWFGDWENDPKNASKVVGENGNPQETYGTGKPVKVYHGTADAFDEFETGHEGKNAAHVGPGFYFAEDRAVAETFTGSDRKGAILESYLSVRNPLDFDSVPSSDEIKKWAEEVSKLEPTAKTSAFIREAAQLADYEERALTAFDIWKIAAPMVGRDGANR